MRRSQEPRYARLFRFQRLAAFSIQHMTAIIYVYEPDEHIVGCHAPRAFAPSGRMWSGNAFIGLKTHQAPQCSPKKLPQGTRRWYSTRRSTWVPILQRMELHVTVQQQGHAKDDAGQAAGMENKSRGKQRIEKEVRVGRSLEARAMCSRPQCSETTTEGPCGMRHAPVATRRRETRKPVPQENEGGLHSRTNGRARLQLGKCHVARGRPETGET